jgi:uncharacterized protein (DUF111 family)
MKTLYFDCFAGASGDMILGATVAAGVDPGYLREQLSLLPVTGFSIDFETVNRSGLSATYARVETAHEHSHRSLADIKEIIDGSDLSRGVKQRAIAIFTRLAEAEARVHNEPVDHVHFHEVGALDVSTLCRSSGLSARHCTSAVAWLKWPTATFRSRRPRLLSCSKAFLFTQPRSKVNC